MFESKYKVQLVYFKYKGTNFIKLMFRLKQSTQMLIIIDAEF
jgi:hypothetical protein